MARRTYTLTYLQWFRGTRKPLQYEDSLAAADLRDACIKLYVKTIDLKLDGMACRKVEIVSAFAGPELTM